MIAVYGSKMSTRFVVDCDVVQDVIRTDGPDEFVRPRFGVCSSDRFCTPSWPLLPHAGSCLLLADVFMGTCRFVLARCTTGSPDCKVALRPRVAVRCSCVCLMYFLQRVRPGLWAVDRNPTGSVRGFQKCLDVVTWCTGVGAAAPVWWPDLCIAFCLAWRT